MKRIYKINITFILLMTITTLFISCEYGDTNNDITRPDESIVPINAIMPVMQTQSHRNITAGLARLAGIVMQQWIGADAQQVGYTNYVIEETDSDNFWDTGIYVGSMRDCVQIINKIEDSNGINTRGIAKIYLAANLGMATNVWGDIPFSEAFQGEDNLFPAYDPQESIYEAIFRILDEAIADLTAEDTSGGIQGSLVSLTNAQWIQVANALKARYYLQLTKVNPQAASNALGALENAMTSNDDQAVFDWRNNQNEGNPLALFGVGRPETMIVDSRFADLMDGDPRKSSYMVLVEGSNLFYQQGNDNLFWGRLESPGILIPYWEQKFIEAEALERTGEDGSDALVAAVTANMEYIGIPSPQIAIYTSELALGGALEADLETIISEKYKALYGVAPIEVWNDYRRTGIPELTPSSDGSNGLNPSGIIPRRLLYPISERVSNPESYADAISRQGGHLLDDGTWAFQ
ncbi:SusD/RagB family nutrient-binding outer membrane lipoprotein [Aquimarina sp. U1-2]|uniref:SusD/RagB family nutrient-binding outer membrane lipoprotein n=1 Tax=Aquimarina sp. U1-2 TaxID=2823141 RepID=UPI001AEC9E7F|nr:SusD/RagB family nutrient-binding outer membrane lipoprotein [Aquimarina sp. U1-2]MBP2830954.1 SusD/RagB family nutrient-binding outer membrane lipoprotein [Aquimarina sp. U1-2]